MITHKPGAKWGVDAAVSACGVYELKDLYLFVCLITRLKNYFPHVSSDLYYLTWGKSRHRVNINKENGWLSKLKLVSQLDSYNVWTMTQ